MNFSKENHEIVRQNDKNVKKSQKHDANVQKNTTLYFQIGLILTLLLVHGMFEMQFESKPIEIVQNTYDDDEIFMADVPITVLKQEIAEVQPKKQRKPVIFKDPVIVDDDEPIIDTDDIFTEPLTTDKPVIDVSDLDDIVPIEEDITTSILAVQQVPVYPGCEDASNNLERRKCMEQKLAKLIDRKFDTDIASEYGLTGIQKIYVQFKIDKSGTVTDVQTRAPHKALAKEAKKVIGKIPQMQPGKQNDKAVNVIYSLPILFQVQD